MIIVGLVALLIWAAMMGTRSYAYYQLAREHGSYEHGFREQTPVDYVHILNPGCRPGCRQVMPIEEFVEYHAILARKYRRAMHYPWLPVAPDPPTWAFRRP
jgi:hypothetical protein